MWVLCSALIVALALLPAGSFRADIFQVTKTDDTNDDTCGPDSSLREAIDAAAGLQVAGINLDLDWRNRMVG